MSNFGRALKIVGGIVAIIAAGVLIGWLGSTGFRSPSSTPPQVSSASGPNASPGSAPAPASNSSTPHRTQTARGQSGAGVAPADVITNWEDRVDEILVGDKPDPDKANQMLEMFPRLPEDGQREVAQHLANLVPDENYGSLAQVLTNSVLPDSVLDVLLADALNRPNSLKLPVLLAVARDPQNPKATEAKDVLQLFLEADYGNDWTTWQAKVDQWLKDNPD